MNEKKKQSSGIKLFTNWQLVAISTTIFVVMLFFADNSNINYKIELEKRLEKSIVERDSLLEEIHRDSNIIEKIRIDNDFLERYARENFYYRAPDEDVFILNEEKNDRK